MNFISELSGLSPDVVFIIALLFPIGIILLLMLLKLKSAISDRNVKKRRKSFKIIDGHKKDVVSFKKK